MVHLRFGIAFFFVFIPVTCFLDVSFFSSPSSFYLTTNYQRMTVSPLSVRQWKDAEGNPQEQKNHNSSNNSNSSHPHNSTDIRDNNDVDTGQTLNVPAAQTLLLQQVLPLYAEMAQSFSTHRTLDAKHLSILLEQLQALATSLHIHLEQAIRNKILLNGRKYPVEQAKVRI